MFRFKCSRETLLLSEENLPFPPPPGLGPNGAASPGPPPAPPAPEGGRYVFSRRAALHIPIAAAIIMT